MSKQLIGSLIHCLTLLIFVCAPAAHAQQGATDGEWRHYGGDSGHTKYSPLAQIDTSNFAELEIAWRWKSVDGQFDLDQLKKDYPNLLIKNDVEAVTISRMKGAPLMVDGVLYVLTAMYQAAAGMGGGGGSAQTHT